LVIFGATGFTGALVAEYLANKLKQNADEDPRLKDLQWAIAGRNTKNLEALKANLISINNNLESVGIITADSKDEQSIDRMVQQTKVIISTAGPFIEYSPPVVDACIRYGVHYVDITGEIPFVRKMRSKYHEDAKAKGIYIVPCCGYDSAPSDLGTLYLVERVKKELNQDCSSVTNYITGLKGGVSGGTFQTLMSQVTTKSPNPQENVRRKDVMLFGRDKQHSVWRAPFLMSVVNCAVVRDSNKFLDGYYGKDFRYSEGFGYKSFFSALFITIGMTLFIMAVMFPPTRSLINRFGLKPGQGPSKEKREKGFFKMKFYAKPENNKKELCVSVTGKGDPGYKLTSMMVCESALCLLFDLNLFPRDKPEQNKRKTNLKGGVLTPASAMGQLLIDRFNQNGITFKYE